MFQKSCVPSSGRPFVHAVLYGMFIMLLCKQANRWKDVQMVFLMMDTRCSKHVEDTKNWIKTLFLKLCILLVHIT